MRTSDPLDLLAFNVKLLGRRSKKKLLVSAGKEADKERMLPSIVRLLELSVDLYATPGTARFFDRHGVPNTLIYKIADQREPNILSLLKQDQFDLVINVLTGDQDYDEKTDVNLIRTLAIENGIPRMADDEPARICLHFFAASCVM